MTEPSLLVDRVWRSDLLDSVEHFRLLKLDDGFLMTGEVTIAFQGEKAGIAYELDTRVDWRTRGAAISIPHIGTDLDVTVDESGEWWINGRARSELRGCTDIDLGWTPATNTLPMRRTQAEIGTTTTVNAAWLRWPELDLVAARQTYTRRAQTTWLYEQGDFSAVLQVDRQGVVITYGEPPIWYSASEKITGAER